MEMRLHVESGSAQEYMFSLVKCSKQRKSVFIPFRSSLYVTVSAAREWNYRCFTHQTDSNPEDRPPWLHPLA